MKLTENKRNKKIEKNKTILRKVGTWNIRSIRGKEIELCNEFEKTNLDILVVTETKKKKEKGSTSSQTNMY